MGVVNPFCILCPICEENLLVKEYNNDIDDVRESVCKHGHYSTLRMGLKYFFKVGKTQVQFYTLKDVFENIESLNELVSEARKDFRTIYSPWEVQWIEDENIHSR